MPTSQDGSNPQSLKSDWLRPIERFLAGVSAVCILATTVIVGTDVAMRYVFNAPLPWAYDVVSKYLLIGAFYLALPTSYREGSHVRVDLLLPRYSTPVRRVCEMVTCACGAIVLGAIAVVGYERAVTSFMGGEVVVGLFAWPTWLSVVFIPIGAGLLALRLVVSLVAHGLSLVSGKELIALPLSSDQNAMLGKAAE